MRAQGVIKKDKGAIIAPLPFCRLVKLTDFQ
jgi:hypothetical protein